MVVSLRFHIAICRHALRRTVTAMHPVLRQPGTLSSRRKRTLNMHSGGLAYHLGMPQFSQDLGLLRKLDREAGAAGS